MTLQVFPAYVYIQAKGLDSGVGKIQVCSMTTRKLERGSMPVYKVWRVAGSRHPRFRLPMSCALLGVWCLPSPLNSCKNVEEFGLSKLALLGVYVSDELVERLNDEAAMLVTN